MTFAIRLVATALLFVGMLGAASAQDARALSTHLKVTGIVLDAKKGKPLKDAKVELLTYNKLVETVVIDKSGSFELILDFDKTHEVRITAEGYVGQHWTFDSKGLSTVDKQYDYEYNGVNARLVLAVPGASYSAFEMPIQQVKFDSAQEGFFADEAHEELWQKEYDKMMLKLEEMEEK